MTTAHVYEAINAVQEDLSKIGISKDQKNQQQGFSFRGIDDVLNALSALLAKHKLVIMPVVTERNMVERQTRSGGILFCVTIAVDYTLVSAVDASSHTVRIYGEAADHGDKATNKAMSAAYKYMAIQTFAIPTKGDNDPDATTHEIVARNIPVEIDECQSLPELQGVWSTLTHAEQAQYRQMKDAKKAELGPDSIPNFLTPQAE